MHKVEVLPINFARQLQEAADHVLGLIEVSESPCPLMVSFQEFNLTNIFLRVLFQVTIMSFQGIMMSSLKIHHHYSSLLTLCWFQFSNSLNTFDHCFMPKESQSCWVHTLTFETQPLSHFVFPYLAAG